MPPPPPPPPPLPPPTVPSNDGNTMVAFGGFNLGAIVSSGFGEEFASSLGNITAPAPLSSVLVLPRESLKLLSASGVAEPVITCRLPEYSRGLEFSDAAPRVIVVGIAVELLSTTVTWPSGENWSFAYFSPPVKPEPVHRPNDFLARSVSNSAETGSPTRPTT